MIAAIRPYVREAHESCLSVERQVPLGANENHCIVTMVPASVVRGSPVVYRRGTQPRAEIPILRLTISMYAQIPSATVELYCQTG